MQDQVVLLPFYVKYSPFNAVKPCCETQNSRLTSLPAFLSFVDNDGLPMFSSFYSDTWPFLNQLFESCAVDFCKSFISVNHMEAYKTVCF